MAAGAIRNVILSTRDGLPGDMNAYPDMPEVALFRNAGLKDAFLEAGVGSGCTFPATAPQNRIDYIWLSADLKASNVVIPPEVASDHLGVVATVGSARSLTSH